MGFLIYDIILFALFTIAAAAFFYKRRENFKTEGPLYLYRTKLGLKLIDWFGKKHARILKPIQYIVIFSGYSLMIFMLWFLARFAYIYITSPFIAKAIKVPVIFPLVPYLPEIFKIDFLPPFYFTYWIVIIAIIAIPHEFAHGIFARLNNVGLKSTGFGFLRLFKLPTPFLAAFVEQDDKQMDKAPKFAQLSILAAGTFANVLLTILFGLIMWLFFIASFSPAGIVFNSYAYSTINVSDISSINNTLVGEIGDILDSNQSFISLMAENRTYYSNPGVLKQSLNSNLPYIQVYDDSPAFKAKLPNIIKKINGESITSYESLKKSLSHHNSGDIVRITAMSENEEENYIISLGERDDKAYLGVAMVPPDSRGILGFFYRFISKIKDPFVYYESSIGDLGIFIYNLLWWLVIINISVALTNMLPVGIFDGGRFFMLSVWGITGSKKIGMRAFQAMTWIILMLVGLLMLKWAFAVF